MFFQQSTNLFDEKSEVNTSIKHCVYSNCGIVNQVKGIDSNVETKT